MKEYTLEQLVVLLRCVAYTFGDNDIHKLDDETLLFWMDEIKKEILTKEK